MSLVKELEMVLESGTRDKKIELLSYLNDIFESYNKNIDDFSEMINILIKHIDKEKDEEIAEEILNTIIFAETYQDVKDIDFSPLSENLDKVSGNILARCIDALSYTDNQHFIPCILRFRESNDETVRNSVEEALVELRYKK
jgi:hypothetical protein